MFMSTILATLALLLLTNVHPVYVQDLNDASVAANAGGAAVSSNVGPNNQPSIRPQNGTLIGSILDQVPHTYEAWTKCPLFLPPFEANVFTIPDVQKEFVNNMVTNDLELFREILREAINNRNKFAPSVSLMWKYTGKLLSRFISNRREEQKISPRVEPLPSFFELLASTAEQVIDRSDQIKKERGYNKNSVDVDQLYDRVDCAFKYFQKVITHAPMGAYLKWNQLMFYRDEPAHPAHGRDVYEEVGDLTAQFRAMGYDKCIFVARRIINLLRMFSRGSIPESDKDV